ncbi:MAG TPA: hypothetical protein VJP89_06000 [Pyrinomonadaceae bacterium]|nr:hypothetical protein [Pyrinomonadaceae bacterium]
MNEGMNLDRLYDLLPVIYRQRDTEVGQPLRALLQVISEQVNIVEADIAQLYENWFIETCEDWVVPYIADLIGYRVVHEAGEPGRPTTDAARQRNKILIPRREVANTIRYRRRKGTVALLELLAQDVAGWPARAVEFYQNLLCGQHVNHLRPQHGRIIDVRHGDAADLLAGPFDQLAHTVDVRRVNSRYATGRYGITNAGLFVWRLKPYSITRAPAFCLDRARQQYTFSMLGNNAPLFTKPVDEPDPTHTADEMNVPAPIRRRALEERTADYYGEGKSFCIWREGSDKPISPQRIVVADLSRWTYRPQGDQVVVDPKLGRIAFAKRSDPNAGVWVSYHYGFSADLGGGEYERKLRTPRNAEIRSKDSELSRPDGAYVYLVSQQHSQQPYFENLTSALQKWASDDPDNAIIQIEDSAVYVEQLAVRFSRNNQRLEIRAANGRRPAIRLLDWYTHRPDSLGIVGPSSEEQTEHAASSHAPRLILDGLLITGRGVEISGHLSQILIRHCTLVPGWSLDNKCNPENESEPSLLLTNTRTVLAIEHSIVGSIVINQNEVTTEPITIRISDSILDAVRGDLNALSGPDNTFAHAELLIQRSTVFGLVRTHAIKLAENAIFNDRVTVVRSQHGCMRFCYVAPGSRTPRRYHCQPDGAEAAAIERLRQIARRANAPAPSKAEIEAAQRSARSRVRPQFNSVRYGTPAYCQLAFTCAQEIKRGADDESEMGVFHDLYQTQREANLRARLDEYTPAGIDSGIIFVT